MASMVVWLNEILSNIANISSVVALLLSIWVLVSIGRIRRHFELKSRIPELISELEKFSKELNDYIGDTENNKREVIALSKQMHFTLKTLKSKARANADIVKIVNLMLSRIDRLKKGKPFQWNPFAKKVCWSFNEEAWELYTDIQGVLQGLKEAKKDADWSQQ